VKRREFITLLGGTVAAWPLMARAQQPEQIRRIGVLMGYPEAQSEFASFVQELQKLGWAEGRNLRTDIRWGIPADPESMHRFAKELVALQPELILSQSTPTTAALLQETPTIPIVFAIVADPVGSGFVASLARPGGNATGFVVTEGSLGGKWLELLKEIAPRVTRIAALFNPAMAPYDPAPGSTGLGQDHIARVVSLAETASPTNRERWRLWRSRWPWLQAVGLDVHRGRWARCLMSSARALASEHSSSTLRRSCSLGILLLAIGMVLSC
jgi:ABC transporter substrate binding protein